MTKNIIFSFFLISVFYLTSCLQDNFDTAPDIQLQFSTDSVVFDTIFSGIGSATRYFKVYNPSDKKINISEIRLGKDNASKYRINVDGFI